MLDPILIIQALSLATIASAAVALAGRLLGSPRRRTLSAIGAIAGIGVGTLLGSWFLGWRPRWTLVEERDRLLVVLLPVVVLGEAMAACSGRARRLAWVIRAVVAAGAARWLLDGTTYLRDFDGIPRQWTAAQAWMILSSLAMALAANWFAQAALQKRTGSAVPLVVLICSSGGAGVAVALSGYASGGLLGLLSAGALAGALIASLTAGNWDRRGMVGVGVVLQFAVLMSGCFFGSLPATDALLLFFGPLLCWLLEAPPRLRAWSRLLLGVLPIALALWLAQGRFFSEASQQPRPARLPLPPADLPELTPDDHLNYRK